MSFFKKLKDRLFKSSSKLDEGLEAIVEDGGEVEEPAALAEPDTPSGPSPEEERAATEAKEQAAQAEQERLARDAADAKAAAEAEAQRARDAAEAARQEQQREADAQAAQAKAEAEAAEAARSEAEAAASAAAAAAKAEAEAAEAARQEAERKAAAEAEAARMEAARLEQARIDAEATAKAQADADEAERAAATQREVERQAAAQMAEDRAEAARQEAARLAAERAEADRLAAKAAEDARAEAARIEAERVEAARLEAERAAEAERIAQQLQAERDAAAEAERRAADQAAQVAARREAEAAAQAETARQVAVQAAQDAQDAAAAQASQPDPSAGAASNPGILGRLFGRREKKAVVRRTLDDDMLEQLEELLISADMGVDTALRVTANMAEGRFGKKLSVQEIKELLAQEIARIMEPVARPLPLFPKTPQVVLVVGVNGSGKTTTIGKLAAQFRAAGKKVVIAAGDTFRAAAVEQLQVWGERAGVPVLTAPEGSDPASLAFDAMTKAQADGADLLMIDTAGRLQNRTDLMEELAKIVRVIRKHDDTAPHNTLLVLDATTGQNALSQVKIFQEVSDVSGLVMTKLDGTAKGGVLVALADKFGLPIHAIGVGEQIDDLAPFDPEEFAAALTGLERD